VTAVLKAKQEKIFKELRALPANKTCFDCGTHAPTYVNMTVNTFICQSCGGLLRELQHRVKGISM
jgi:ADP-ribosylation factor GTPase-activating protein 2/3